MDETTERIVIEVPARERGLRPNEVDARIGAAAKAGDLCGAALAFYLAEVEARNLHLGFGYPTVPKYAEGRHGISEAPCLCCVL